MAETPPREPYRPFPTFAEWVAQPLELRFWNEALATLAQERENAPEAAVREAAEVVTRAAAVDTAAIEGLYNVDRGFTFSVAMQAAAWQNAFDERGAHARSMFEAQLRASELVLDAATSQYPVTEALIRSLHEHVCSAQETYKVLTDQGWQEHQFEKGTYKRFPNNPRTADGREHAYALPEEVPFEMRRLVTELQSEAFANAPAPVQAAYAHYGFVAIHPFPDGNGRVARALASIYLVRASSVPLLIFADQKTRYLDALAEADRGNFTALSQFVRERSIDAINLLISGLQRAKISAGNLRAQANQLYFPAHLTHAQVKFLAERLLDETLGQLRATFDSQGFPSQLILSAKIRPGNPPMLDVIVTSAWPAFSQARAFVRLQIPIGAHPSQSPIRLEVVDRGLHFDVRTEDLFPEISAIVHFRLRTWVETLVLKLVEEALQQGRASLEESE
jgi:Fic family protein